MSSCTWIEASREGREGQGDRRNLPVRGEEFSATFASGKGDPDFLTRTIIQLKMIVTNGRTNHWPARDSSCGKTGLA